jgi:predicted NAD/FAD-binding protein
VLAKASTFSRPLFDETAMRTPRRRSSTRAARVSAGMRAELQRAGLPLSNRSEAAWLRASPGKMSSSCAMKGKPQVAR